MAKNSLSSASPLSGLLVCAVVFLCAATATATSAAATSTTFDYKDAMSKSLLYFEAQRSGHLPENQRVVWRDHSALTDGRKQGVNLVGGYYDAGDNVKFGLPMAFTITMLSWSVIDYGREIAASGEYGHALEAIKWGTDYFIKAHPQPNVLWMQVGDGKSDHTCWQRPEDMTTTRQAYKIDANRPGSEVAAETAAAMAAASIVFKTTDQRYSRLLLRHAQQLFDFADKHRAQYDQSVKAVRNFYQSSGYGDELLWAALWLHRATGRANYLNFVVKNAHELNGADWGVKEFSWDIKYPGLQILASKLLMERGSQLDKQQKQVLEQYKSKAEYYLCSCLGKNEDGDNVAKTPGGLLYVRRWNNMQHVSSAAFLLTSYSDQLTRAGQELACPNGPPVKPHELLAFAKSQADYILGSNPMKTSYLVGFGSTYPKRVHHRGASIISFKTSKNFVGCMEGYKNWFGRQRENPNVLVGALVGGPDGHDRFRDKRGNYEQTEACTYNTAPLVGVFARLGVQPPTSTN